MSTYPEKGLIPPLRPKKITPKVYQRHSLERLVTEAVANQFDVLFQERYGFRPRPYRNPQDFSKALHSSINAIAEDFYPDHSKEWKSLPEFTSPDQHKKALAERIQIGIEFVDWLFGERKKFGDACWGDMISPHWWTAYGQKIAKANATDKDDATNGWDDLKSIYDFKKSV